MDLPVYLLDISEDMNDDAEVDYVALVDKPAIQKIGMPLKINNALKWLAKISVLFLDLLCWLTYLFFAAMLLTAITMWSFLKILFLRLRKSFSKEATNQT